MVFTENEIKKYEAPLSRSEEERCKNAIRMVRDVLKRYGYSDGNKEIRVAYSDTYAYMLTMNNNSNGRSIKLLIQGSYANNTNVRTKSDVDIAVILESAFKTLYKEGVTDKTYGFSNSSDSLSKFKDDIEDILKDRFGNDVERKNKSIKIKGNTYRVNTDTVPCMRYRDYSKDYLTEGNFVGSIYIQADDGSSIINYPEQHIYNGKKKNVDTNRLYKKMVRIIKKMRYLMEELGYSEAKNVSSFVLESLLWNIPNSFYKKYSDYRHVFIFQNIINYINHNRFNLSLYTEANGIKPLCCDDNSSTSLREFIECLKNFYKYE